MKSDFARNIYALRQKKRFSQRRAAEELGISQALLSHYENGVREPRLPFVRVLADYYGVSADALLGVPSLGGCELSERAQAEVTRALTFAHRAGGDVIARAAAKYLMAAADKLIAIIENPNQPYDPRFYFDFKTAEAELYDSCRQGAEAELA